MTNLSRIIKYIFAISLLLSQAREITARENIEETKANQPTNNQKEIIGINKATNNLNQQETVNDITASSVKIVGPVDGSGVIIESTKNRYTVLTAWHVIKGISPKETILIVTSEDKQHNGQHSSIKRIGKSDMATIEFESKERYRIAKMLEIQFERNLPIMIAGYPSHQYSLEISQGWIAISTVDYIDAGNPNIFMDQGYQLIYSNNTKKGMSGGGIYTTKGALIGIHGRGELDRQATQRKNSITKSGVSYGMPINLFLDPLKANIERLNTIEIKNPDALTLEIALESAGEMLEGEERLAIALADQILSIKKTFPAYYIKHRALAAIGDYAADLDVLNKMLALKGLTTIERRLALIGRYAVHSKLNQVENAMEDQKILLAMAKTKDEEAGALLSIGNLFDRKNQREEANKYYAKVEELLKTGELSDLQSFLINQSAAMTSSSDGKKEEAESFANKALAFPVPQSLKKSLRLYLATEIYTNTGRFDEALAKVNQLIDEDPLDIDALEARGDIYMHLKDAEKLEENALRILDFKPRNHVALQHMSFSYILRKDIKGACFYFRRADQERAGSGFYKFLDHECTKYGF